MAETREDIYTASGMTPRCFGEGLRWGRAHVNWLHSGAPGGWYHTYARCTGCEDCDGTGEQKERDDGEG